MTDIAFFLRDLSGGGAEKVMLSIAGGFAEQGLNVDLVLLKTEGEYLSLISPKLRVLNLKGRRLITSLPLLGNYLKLNHPKILISALEESNIISIIAKWLAGVSSRVIVSAHNHISCESQNSNQLKQQLKPLFVRWFYPLADEIVAVSQGVAEDVAQISGLPLEKIKVIYNPIFTSELLEKFHEPVNHPWFLKNQLPVILGVGRLEKQKDFPTLIRAFALVRQQYPARLMILGKGDELPYLKALVNELSLEKDIIFPGFVANPYAYMARAKLLVLSSVFEGFGNVLVEAMIAGTPVVSTNCESGPAEILANGKYGNLVAVGDVRDLAEAMISTLKNPLTSELLQRRGREFSLDVALSLYQQVFNFN